MFDWFKNRKPAPVWRHPDEIKAQTEVFEKMKPKSILPDDLVAKIKIEMVKCATDVPKIQPITEQVKKGLVINYINKLPIIFKEALKENKETAYFFSTHINSNWLSPDYIRDCGGTDTIFEQISDDLVSTLKEIGIGVKYKGKSAIMVEIKDLKRFCNFEKLAVLK